MLSLFCFYEQFPVRLASKRKPGFSDITHPATIASEKGEFGTQPSLHSQQRDWRIPAADKAREFGLKGMITQEGASFWGLEVNDID